MFYTPGISTEQFKGFFNDNFTRSHYSDDPISRYTNMQQSLIDASHRAKQFCTNRKTGDAALQDAIKLLNAVEAKDPDVTSKFAHIPEFLAFADSPEQLLEKINLEFSKRPSMLALAPDFPGLRPSKERFLPLVLESLPYMTKLISSQMTPGK
jgi:hypothetical protein